MKKYLLCLAIVTPIIFLIGCAGSPMKLSGMTSEELQLENSFSLCNAYNFNKKEQFRTELERRNALSSQEWEMIDSNYIQIGMSEIALWCLKGGIMEGINGSINTTTGSWGVHKQYVYRPLGMSGSAHYVYVENGKVTSWQN